MPRVNVSQSKTAIQLASIGTRVRFPAFASDFGLGRPAFGLAQETGGRMHTTPFNPAQRASVGSAEALNGRLARFGRIDRSSERSRCARRCRRTQRQYRMLLSCGM
jgi:hypothetical protein